MGAASEIRAGPVPRWFAAGAAVVAAACAWACAPVVNAAVHAVAGTVTIGPQCGGPQREGQTCDIDYEAVEVRLLDAQGAVAASGRTDAKGRFSLAAPRQRADGLWLARAEPLAADTLRVVSPKIVRCPEHSVVLPSSRSVPLVVACDSGQR